MKITLKKCSEQSTMVRLEGKLKIGDTLTFRNAVRGVKGNVILDLSGVTMLDSTGVAEMVAAWNDKHNRKQKLVLLNPTSKIKDVLTVTQLITVFEIFEDEQEAIDSFIVVR